MTLAACRPLASSIALGLALAAPIWPVVGFAAPAEVPHTTGSVADPFAAFELPDPWEAQFWADPGVKHLLGLDPKAVAAMVPVQAGIKHCRCPGCGSRETDETLGWTPLKPAVMTCRACDASFPNDQIPAKVPPAPGQPPVVPIETIEVRPGIVHKYAYHTVDPLKQLYPDERLYLDAKRDYEAREFLAKVAMYAAVRYREQAEGVQDAALARLAAVLVLRFAQVYPDYAAHLDQPGQPKSFQPAELRPPFRRGYQTGKWDWLACLDVPVNLAVAYAVVRNTPALAEAGRLLGEADPRAKVERDLFRASAAFVRAQAEEYSESSLYAYRGLLTVGRLLDDPALMHDAIGRLEGFAQRGFHHDGYWRQGELKAHRRVVAQIDGWIDRLIAGYSDPEDAISVPSPRFRSLPGAAVVPQVMLARGAAAVPLAETAGADVQPVSWPSIRIDGPPRHPGLLGGAGVARLSVGRGAQALDVELRGLGDFESPRSNRLALRVAVGGRTVLGDLDDLPPTINGWDLATASHNTVTVDGLNRRENLDLARLPAPGADVRFFAADADFQVVALEDRHAYPNAADRYRRLVVAAGDGTSGYAVSVFDVAGGLQHDEIYHGPAGTSERWRVSAPLARGPESLLPRGIVYLPTARADDRRWFVQAYGSFFDLEQGRLDRFGMAELRPAPGDPAPGIRLHVLSEGACQVISAESRASVRSDSSNSVDPYARPSLIVRRRSTDGTPLDEPFVTLLEPLTGGEVPFRRVGRIASDPDLVVLMVESTNGVEYLVLNLRPGTRRDAKLGDGRTLSTDGLAVRVGVDRLSLAGGTFAECDGLPAANMERIAGAILETTRAASEAGRGAFRVDTAIPEPEAVVGRALLIRHGDGTSRAWTVTGVQGDEQAGTWITVREEPGFAIAPETGAAHYYQFPRFRVPGPHQFVISRIATAGPNRSTGTPVDPERTSVR